MKTYLLLLIFFLFSSVCFGQTQITSEKLYLVKSIYIDDMGKSDEAERFRLILNDKISKKGFKIVNKPEDADAVLTGIFTIRVYSDKSSALATVYLKVRDSNIWGGDFEPKISLSIKDTVTNRAENIADKLRKDWEKSAKTAGVTFDKIK